MTEKQLKLIKSLKRAFKNCSKENLSFAGIDENLLVWDNKKIDTKIIPSSIFLKYKNETDDFMFIKVDGYIDSGSF